MAPEKPESSARRGRWPWGCRAALLAPPLLVAVAALQLRWRALGALFRPGLPSLGVVGVPGVRRLFAMQQEGPARYAVAFRGAVCQDPNASLFDNKLMEGRRGYRLQAECEQKCDQDSRCEFMLWGWDLSGYYRCATYQTCNSQVPNEDGDPDVFRRVHLEEEHEQNKEPHALWVEGTYTARDDPMTMEFCSLDGSCDVFGPAAPLPPSTGAVRACGARGGKWCSMTPPLDDLFSPVDGGTGRACRRTAEDDNKKQYYLVKKLDPSAGFKECQGLCMAHGGCTGIEHIAFRKEHRCEIWEMRIMSTLPLGTATCLRHVNWLDAPNCCLKGPCGACEDMGGLGATDRDSCALEGGQWCDPPCRWYGLFAPVDGGVDRACRGAGPWDADPGYFETHTLGVQDSMVHCKRLCLDSHSRCKGIEYTELSGGPRCRVWTRQAGIGTTQQAEGSVCLRWTR